MIQSCFLFSLPQALHERAKIAQKAKKKPLTSTKTTSGAAATEKNGKPNSSAVIKVAMIPNFIRSPLRKVFATSHSRVNLLFANGA